MAANVVFVLGVVVEAEVAKHNCVRLVLKQPLKHILALELAIDDTICSVKGLKVAGGYIKRVQTLSHLRLLSDLLDLQVELS